MQSPLRLGLRLVYFYLCALSGAAAAHAANKPNVIVIVADDAAYRDFGFSAALTNATSESLTPNLDSLAQQSVVSRQYYSANPLCSPTRAGLLTGEYPMRYGYEYNLYNHGYQAGTQGLKPEQITLAQRLKPLGYTTGLIGKWHLGYQEGLNRPLDKGFDEFFGFFGGASDYFGAPQGIDHGIWRNDEFNGTDWRSEGDPSRYDPVKGRYLTDALGEEAVDFINRHANDEQPFFLYLPMTAPHEPWQAKQSDLDVFAHITDPNRRLLAAMNHALDRAVGDVTNALEANGIDNETIVIFTTDNGAPYFVTNPPFRGHKGTTWEGGIRVPFTIKAPGLTPGITDQIVTGLDIVPTIVAAAGGDITQFAHDGYDVMPYLSGQQTDDPNKVYFWRNFDSYAIRKGDWKLVLPFYGSPGPHLFNIGNDPTESVFGLYLTQPAKYAELHRELANMEAQMAKPEWYDLGANQNLFDHFVFRNDLSTTANWSTANNWRQADTTNNATLKPADAYANAIIEFGVRNDADYTATNNMMRMSRQTFMLNQIKLTGDFDGAVSRQGLINGNAVLFVKSLNNQLPQINLSATASSGAQKFTFRLDTEIQLFHDLEITGDGTQNFVIGGNIRDYYEPNEQNVTTAASVRKLGTSVVTLSGNNTFRGSFKVDEGEAILDGPSAAINGAASIVVGSAGKFTLQNGTVKVNTVDISSGGDFDFNGGTLTAVNVLGNLTNNGGVFSPGNSPAASKVVGNYDQNVGKLQIEIGGAAAGSQYDSLTVTGTAELADTLGVQLINGYSPTAGSAFQVLSAGAGVQGSFSTTMLPALSPGLFWNVMYGANSVVLAVAPTNSLNYIPGDFNQDGSVDAADYTMWRDRQGTASSLGDANFDGLVTIADYNLWRSNFGYSLTGMGHAALAQVPEPGTALMFGIGAVLIVARQARRMDRSAH